MKNNQAVFGIIVLLTLFAIGYVGGKIYQDGQRKKIQNSGAPPIGVQP